MTFVQNIKNVPLCGFTPPTKYVKEGLAKIYGEWKEPGGKENILVRKEFT